MKPKTPKRIQRKRTKGWRMPEGAVSVTRPGKWGNPFKVIQDNDFLADWRVLDTRDNHRYMTRYPSEGDALTDCLKKYRIYAERHLNLDKLRGKDLACFCKLTDPCHADILIELANQEATE